MFVVRLRYYVYENGTVETGVGYMTHDGGVSRELRDAHRYDSEAEAWEHAFDSDNIGRDDDGEWCWVEEG